MSDRLSGAGRMHPLWQHIGGLHADLQHAGTNLNAAAVFCMEGGKGGRGADGGADQNHSTDNMVLLLGGRAGGLRTGQHVLAQDVHVAAAMNTALRAVGVPDTLGEIPGTLTALL